MAILRAALRRRFPGERCDHWAASALLALLAVVFASFLAALAAHVVIDIVGDYALAHDAYDGVDHGSRSTVVILGLAVTLGTGAFALWCCVAERNAGRIALGRMLKPDSARSFLPFLVAVTGGTLATLVAMESLDTLAQSGRLDDLQDLLGGSIGLAIAIALPIACVAALATRRLLGALLRSCRDLATLAVLSLLEILERFDCGRCVRRGARTQRSRPRTSPLARRAGKRAPPLFAIA